MIEKRRRGQVCSAREEKMIQTNKNSVSVTKGYSGINHG